MIACPKCGWELTPGARACRRCGAVIPGAGAPPVSGAERAPLGSEQLPGEDTARAQLQRSVASLYTVEQLLGRGPTTAVYKGAELNPPRPVAIKVLPAGLGVGPAAAPFKDEARKAMALNHPNIVPIYRVGLRGGAPYFVATKLVDGRSLDAILTSQGPLPLSAMLVVLRVTAEALNYAHGRGTAHGHLKAANVLVDRTGHVMVSDFGIARAIEGAVPGAAGASRLEPAARGGEGPAGDQYALGIVALQMLKGSAPRDADPLVSLRSIAASRGGLPAGLARILETVLAPDPARRYASASDLLAAIKAVPVSDDDRREGNAVLCQFAAGDEAPKVRAPSTAPRVESKTVTRAAATAAAQPAPHAPSARPAPAPPPPPMPAPRAAPPVPQPVADVPAARAEPIAPQAEAAPAPSAVPPTRPATTPSTIQPTRREPALPFTPLPPVEPEPAAAQFEEESAEDAAPPPPARRAPDFSAGQVPAGHPGEGGPSVRERPLMRRARFTPSEHGLLATPAKPPAGRSRLGWAIAALVIVAALAGGALLLMGRKPTAHPQLETTPATRAPNVPAPSAPPAVVAESIRADTARPIRAARAVTRSDTAAPTETTGQLLLSAVPNTAEILLDGETSGSGGFLDSDVTVGRRHLQISAPGYVTLDTTITVRSGATLDLGQITLQGSSAAPAAPAGPPRGWLWVNIVPPTARVLVDGQLAGIGSLTQFEVTAGVRRLQITAPGYQTLDTLVSVDASAEVRLGQLSLRSASGGR